MRFEGSCSAYAEAARSIAGQHAATARNCGGACAPHSPASFSTMLPPMEKPTSARRETPSRAITSRATAATSLDKSGVIEHGSERVGASAIALVVADHVHARSQRLLGDSEHVLRIAGTFESVDDDDGQRARAVRLPVAMAKHLDAGLDFDQALFGRGKMKPSLDQEAGDGLHVSAAQPAAWLERRCVCCRVFA